MITWINAIARKSRFKRFWGIAREVFWIEKFLFFQYDVATIASREDTPFPFRFRIAAPDDIQAMAQTNRHNFFSAEVPYYLKISQGNNFMILMEDQAQRIAYSACLFSAKKFTNRVFQLKDDEAYMLASFTLPEYRRRGIRQRCVFEMCKICHQRKTNKILAVIESSNIASIKSGEKVGAVRTDSGFYQLRIWKRDFIFPFGSLRSRFRRMTPEDKEDIV